MSKNSTQKKEGREQLAKNLENCVIQKVRMYSRFNPAPAEVSGEGSQAACCKERGNGSLHLPAAHPGLLVEAGGL